MFLPGLNILGKIGALEIVLIVVIALVLLVILWIILISNSFKRNIVKIQEADSGIDVALTKRYDLLTKALDTARAYAKHEKETIYEVIKLRQGMTLDEKANAAAKLDKMGNNVNVLAEAYPELRSSEVFVSLQSSITDSEEHLQAARRLYNSNVSQLNQRLVSFPSSVIGRMLNLTQQKFFEAEQQKTQDVKISL